MDQQRKTPEQIFSKLGSMPFCQQELPVQQPVYRGSPWVHGGKVVQLFTPAPLQAGFRWPLTAYQQVSVEDVNRLLREAGW